MIHYDTLLKNYMSKVQRNMFHRYTSYTLLTKDFFFFNLCLAALGLHCCTGFSQAVASKGYSALQCAAFSSVAAPLVAEHRLSRACGLQQCSMGAQGMKLPGSGAQAQ